MNYMIYRTFERSINIATSAACELKDSIIDNHYTTIKSAWNIKNAGKIVKKIK
ncbi:hypothetical protein FACS1894105_09340 [Clostridia bacterium]|nr:hypothetical protein FACS1894105_09340 [Clostridia bacterium]